MGLKNPGKLTGLAKEPMDLDNRVGMECGGWAGHGRAGGKLG